MPGKQSAGILLYRVTDGHPEVLLGHIGGPYWARRDTGAWSIPKGEYEPDETPWDAARREFQEELGLPAPEGTPVPLGDTRQSSGKVVTIWAVPGDLDPEAVNPGSFDLEWPPNSGQVRQFLELDRVAWLDIDTAGEKIVPAQRVFLNRLMEHLSD